jgi:hypothetical protein
VVLSLVAKEGASVSLGQVERTPRAFQQDAWAAMRGDIVRALVEYVTNADDSYALTKPKGTKGRILVEVEHRRGDEPWDARIRDRAGGMTLQEMREKIGKQGVRVSGFAEGKAVRGNLGLGSKDPACFGKVTFESVKDGIYAWFAIDSEGERTAIAKPVRATKEMRDQLGVPANGTVVTIHVTQPVSCPRHESLKQILGAHVLLRDIMQDDDRDLFLLHANNPKAKPERLRYEPPRTTTRVDKKNVELPGYKGAYADLVIAESDEPFPDEGRRSSTRQAGILIKGRRGIYEATLFDFEGNPYALAFTGSITCADIDRIADEYDERAEKHLKQILDNPQPIISRQRDGLAEDHPLYRAIRRLVEAELGPLVIEREKKVKERTRQIESAKTTRLLSQLAKEAAKFMQETAEDEEIDLPPGKIGQEPAPPLAIVPGAIELALGNDRTITVMAAKAGMDPDAELEVELTFAPPGVVSSASDRVRIGPSRRRDDVLTGTTRLSAGASVGATMLNARIGLRTADCAIDVIEPTAPPEPIPPAALEFERPRYRLVLNKPKTVLIRAPLGAYAEGAVIQVNSTTSGIVVLDGAKLSLRSKPEALAMGGTIRVEGRAESATGRLIAADAGRRMTTTEVEVVRREESGTGFNYRLVDDHRGEQRAQWSTDYSLLEIMGEHPAVNPYVGAKEKGYPGQDTPQFTFLVAELMGDAVVRRILLEKYGEDELDAGAFYFYHYKLAARFLARLHRIVAESL